MNTSFTFAGGVAVSLLLSVTVPVQAQSLETPAQIKKFESQVIHRHEFGRDNPKRWTIEQRLAANKVPGAAVAIIEKGQVIWSQGYGRKGRGEGQGVNGDTLFSVGSVSKMVNAALILRLVAKNKLDLDADVNSYLTSWQVPDNRYTRQSKVTLRQILAHTGGFNQHGFGDFLPGQALPTVLDTLEGKSPAKHGPIRVTFEPGSKMDYSGGGITVSQLVVTDVTGLSYPEAAKKYVFEPLGMSRSTFENPLPASAGNIAKAHDEDGKATALPRGWEAMPEMAASGLWTSANDLAKFVIALTESYQGRSDFLPQALARDMMTRVENSWHGLGPRLNGSGPTRVFHHGGANNSYRAWIQGNLTSGNGMVVLTNGTNGSLLNLELRRSAEDAFDWKTKFDGGFEEPSL